MLKPGYLPLFALAAGLILTLAACQSNSAEAPPLPTIVAAKATPTPAPTATTVVERSSATATPAPTGAPPGPEATLATAGETPAEPTATGATVPTPVPATGTPAPTEPVGAGVPLDSLTPGLEPVAGGFTKPLYVSHAGDGSGRLFVVEQAGRIFIVENGQVNPTPFLDIVSIVGSDANEQGLLSVAFHPNYLENGHFFVYYTNKQGDVVIARYQVSGEPNVADPGSGLILLTVAEPYANHNGGQLVFGADGYLYAGLGDGGSGGDPQNNGQRLDTLLGKILRLDVNNGDPYGVPETNPFVGADNARPEIWSYGWRNPWRFSFDRATADMYIADVGQNQYEEVNFEPAGAAGGGNYGWRIMEGLYCFISEGCDPESMGLILPVAEYDHSQGCSVTGGYVYRGQQYPELTGTYLYGDYCSGIIWGLRREAGGGWSEAELLQTNHIISSFGQDEAGEVYVVDHSGGQILRITN